MLPCRDAAETLPEAIASLRAQRFGAFEVLAVDDGSRDATPQLLHDWSARDARVRVLDGAGAGLVAALRCAAAAARGELIARMDADDVAHPDRLASQVRLLDDRPDLVACGTRVRYFPADRVRDGARRYARWLNGLVDGRAIERDLFVECPIAHPTLVMRAAVFRAAGGYVDRGWAEDYDLVLRLAGLGGLANVPRVLLRWRESADRASRTDPRYSPAAFVACKVHHLRARVLGGRAVVVWGAGPVGKAFARELRRQGAVVAAFVELDPRKIGQTIHDAPVIAPGEIDSFRGAFAVAAVGSATARAEIRSSLTAAGWIEIRDFLAVA